MTISSWANPVNQNQAQQVALQFFKSHGVALSSQAKSFRAPQQNGTGNASADAPYYVFNAGDDKGFVIVSGDDRTAPILGYSFSGSVSEEDMPDNMRSFLRSYAEQIEYIQKNNITLSDNSGADREHIDPMLTTQWDQTSPYNLKCPMFGSGYNAERCVTGCVATAMAQVLYYNYYKHPDKMVKVTQSTIDGYNCERNWSRTGQISVSTVPSGSKLDWANMLPKYSGVSTTADQRNAVANLMFYCGASVSMDYVPERYGGSLADNAGAVDAFRTYFGMDPSIQYVSRDFTWTTKEWNDFVYNELKNGRVVLYGGVSNQKTGHSFVINGYDKNDYFYVNWGWSGHGDGAYLLSVLRPEDTVTLSGNVGNGYNVDQTMIINIEPNHNGVRKPAAKALGFSKNGNTLSYTVQNLAIRADGYDYGYGIVGNDGSLTLQGPSTNVSGLSQYYYSRSSRATLDLSTLPDGSYNIVPIAKSTYYGGDWQSLWPDSHVMYITVSNGNVTVNDPQDSPLLGVSSVKVHENADGIVNVYNLQGMKVSTTSANKLSELPKGLYIVSGKKFLVK